MSEQKLVKLAHSTTWLSTILHYAIEVVIVLLIVGLIFVLLRFALRLWDWRQLLRQKYVFIEITPPISANETPLQSTEWINRLYGIGSLRTRKENLQRILFTISLELSSARREGIKFYIRVPEQEADLIKQSISSHLNKVRIRIVKDYLPSSLNYKTTQVVDFKLRSAYFLPLKTEDSFLAHDPFTQLANAMNGINDNERVVLQLVMKPAIVKDTGIILQRIKRNEDMLLHAKQHKNSPLIKLTLGLAFKALREIVTFITDVMYSTPAGSSANSQNLHEHQARAGVKPARSITPSEQALNDTITDKARRSHFRVEVRVLVAGDGKKQAMLRLKSMKAAISAFDTEHQQLRAQWNLLSSMSSRYRLFKFTHRLPSLLQRHSNKLASSEVANIYHFPATGTSTDSLVKSRSPTLPATLTQKRGTDIDVIIGRNVHQERYTDVGLTLKTRMKHMYLIGATGTGKTTMLKGMVYQDMVNGKGLAVLDPHGDMFRELLEIVPENRRNDVVVFDPSDREYPLGLNILDPGVEFANEDDKHEWITSMVLSVFERLADEKQWGSRMEHNLRNATLTALQLPNPSLFTIQRLLTEKSYQREVAKTLKDPVLKQFWSKEFKLMGTMQLANATAPLTHRLGHFITTKMSRHILLQQKSTLRIADIIDGGKILLVNLSKGDIGEDQSFFFGTILTSLIWMAAYQRTKIPEHKRRDFFLYVDEFQNFATKQFTDITSEGRKFHISLVASHQNVAQVEDKNILKIVAGNAHAIVCLKASPDDEAFILPYMEPEVSKGDIVNLNPYHFYMKTTTDESEDAFSGETVPLDVTESGKIAEDVIAKSRKQYGTPKAEVEKYLEELLAGSEKKPKKSVDGNKKSDAPKASESEPEKSKSDADEGVHGA